MDDLEELDQALAHTRALNHEREVKYEPSEEDSAEEEEETKATQESTVSDMRNTVLCPNRLREIAGEPNLDRITSITLQINTESQSLDDLGTWLPNLQHLTLDDSFITSLRDLGRSLRVLETLSLARCGLVDLDGIEALPTLVALLLPFNQVEDVSPLMMHERLQVIDLRHNRIADVEAVDFLASLPRLCTLNCEGGNPLSMRRAYRNIIGSRCAALTQLDGRPIDTTERVAAADEDEVDDHAKRRADASAASQSLASTFSYAPVVRAVSMHEVEIAPSGATMRPQSAHRNKQDSPFRVFASAREGSRSLISRRSVSSASSGDDSRPTSAHPRSQARHVTHDRPQTARPARDDAMDAGSTLTYGSTLIMAGNFGSALRNRRRTHDSRPPSSISVNTGSRSSSAVSSTATSRSAITPPMGDVKILQPAPPNMPMRQSKGGGARARRFRAAPRRP